MLVGSKSMNGSHITRLNAKFFVEDV